MRHRASPQPRPDRSSTTSAGPAPAPRVSRALWVFGWHLRVQRHTAAAVHRCHREGCAEGWICGQSRRREQQRGEVAHSSQGERVFRIADLTGEHQRRPAYAPQAHALGVGSMMGLLLFTDEQDLGALNIYSRKPGAFTENSELAGWLLASHAAVAFSSARTHAQMEQAVSTRHTIGEAMGIPMGARHLTEEQAFDVLRRYSQEKNIKLREVARPACERGSLG
ncbi:GAF and ANTAR domain-containing protein [Streptomyces sp. CA-179760]|uniref:GAF and ANTAR domain-containing protein n=1 Tax=Streptomyces sp. CA-179760 TaxID=3240054 RepID=UPI003D90D716